MFIGAIYFSIFLLSFFFSIFLFLLAIFAISSIISRIVQIFIPKKKQTPFIFQFYTKNYHHPESQNKNDMIEINPKKEN